MVEYIVLDGKLHLKYFGSDEAFKEFLDRTDVEREVYRIKIFEQQGFNNSITVFYNELARRVNH
jgi:hypothetical protein